MNHHILNKKGFILIGIACFSLVIILIIVPLISWSLSEYNWTSRSFKSLQALNLADAGAELAIWEIAHNNGQFMAWSGSNPETLTITPFKNNYENDIGDISISVQNISSNNYLITSTGFVPRSTNIISKKTVKVKVFPQQLFNNAAFGYDSVLLQGMSKVDSYNSSLGPYSALTAGSNGDIGTNGDFSRQGNSTVMGDVFIGPDGSASGNNPPNVTGDTYYFGDTVEPIDVPFSSNYFTTLSSNGNLNLSGHDTAIIPSGDYRYESISLTAQSSLTIGANTRIYINNDFSIAGQAVVYTSAGVILYIGGNGNFAGQGLVNSTGVANNLQIYGMGNGTSFTFTGTSDFYGTVCAQESTINMGGTNNYFGAVIGQTVNLYGTGQLHFDETLSESGPFSGYNIAYWQEG